MHPQDQPRPSGQPSYPQSSPNGVPPIPHNPWSQQPVQPLQQQPQSYQQPAQPQGYQQPTQPAQGYSQAPQQQPYQQPTQQPWPTQPTMPQPTSQFSQQQVPQQTDFTAPEYSIDYLNQIAPKQQRTLNRFAVFSLIGVVILSAILAIFAIVGSQGPSVNQRLSPVSLRIATLETVTKDQQKNLSENEITEANAVLNSSLTSMKADIAAIMKQRKVSNPKSSTTEKSHAAEIKKTLEDAYQKGTLDRTYTAQMTFELTSLKSKLNTIKRQTTSKSITEFCNTSIASIDIVLKAYGEFDATKG